MRKSKYQVDSYNNESEKEILEGQERRENEGKK